MPINGKLAIPSALLIGALVVILLGAVVAADDTKASSLPGLPDDGNYNYVRPADVNKDGYTDLVVTGCGKKGYEGYAPGGVHVYVNQAGTGFSEQSEGLPLPGEPYFGMTQCAVEVVDIDGDSNLDIVATEWQFWTDCNLTIFLGNGGAGGAMKWIRAEAPPELASWISVNCGDIDGDGNLDLLACGEKGLSVWLGDHSKGRLGWKEAVSGIPGSVEFISGSKLADINNDGRLDIVAGSVNGEGIRIYTCSSSGPVEWTEAYSGTSLLTDRIVWDIQMTDLSGDGNLDLIATTNGQGILVYLGNGNAGSRDTWWTAASYGLPTTGKYYQLELGDVNGDGKLDICSSLEVWSHTGKSASTGTKLWEQLGTGVPKAETVGTALADLDGDGKLDIIGCGWDVRSPGIYAYTELKLGSFVSVEGENDPPGGHGNQDDEGPNGPGSLDPASLISNYWHIILGAVLVVIIIAVIVVEVREKTKREDNERMGPGKKEKGKKKTEKKKTEKKEKGKTEKGKTETEKKEEGKTEKGKTETGKTETGKTETGKTETGKTETGKKKNMK